MKAFLALSLAALAHQAAATGSDSITATITPSSPPQTTITNLLSASTIIARPNKWIPLGCYHHDAAKPLLNKTTGNDVFMSVGLCTDRCAQNKYPIAGLQNGNQCWCGSEFNGGVPNKDEKECNVPCPGYAPDMCGGVNALSVFRTERIDLGPSSITTGTASAAPAKPTNGTTGTVLSTVVTGGAMRNYGILGW